MGGFLLYTVICVIPAGILSGVLAVKVGLRRQPARLAPAQADIPMLAPPIPVRSQAPEIAAPGCVQLHAEDLDPAVVHALVQYVRAPAQLEKNLGFSRMLLVIDPEEVEEEIGYNLPIFGFIARDPRGLSFGLLYFSERSEFGEYLEEDVTPYMDKYFYLAPTLPNPLYHSFDGTVREGANIYMYYGRTSNPFSSREELLKSLAEIKYPRLTFLMRDVVKNAAALNEEDLPLGEGNAPVPAGLEHLSPEERKRVEVMWATYARLLSKAKACGFPLGDQAGTSLHTLRTVIQELDEVVTAHTGVATIEGSEKFLASSLTVLEAQVRELEPQVEKAMLERFQNQSVFLADKYGYNNSLNIS